MLNINPVYKPFATRPLGPEKQKSELQGLFHILRFQTAISTWFLTGVVLQSLALYLFSKAYYTALLALAFLSFKLVRTALITKNVIANPYLQGIYPGRNTALLPEIDTGEIVAPSNRKVAVLHLGAKANHPLGALAPQFTKLNDWANLMYKALDANKHPGYMGNTTFNRLDQRGALEFVLISYWDSIESMWAFAHSGTHREGWQWWENEIKDNGYVAINHEIFEVDRKNWETIYINFQPTMLGATSFLKRDGKLEGGVVKDEWISPLVDARRGKLAKSSVRFGREEETQYDLNRVGKETYA